MRRFILALVALVGLSTAVAIANYSMTQGSGTNFGSVVVGGVHYVQSMICDLTTPGQCTSVTAGGALKVDNSGVTQPVSGSVSVSNFPATQPVSGTVAATQSGAWTVQPGNTANTTAWLVTGAGGTFPATQSGNWTSRVVGNGGAVMDFSGQNASSPSNALLMGGQFNSAPTTITSGSSSPFQLDNGGNLKVNIAAGSSAGTVAQGSTTSGQSGNLVQGAVTTSAPTYTTAQTNPLSLTTTGQLRVQDNLAAASVASGAYASGAIGSGAIASGAIASGAIASGAVASGAVSSGAFASGSIAAGAMVDLGATTDAQCSTATGSCSLIALTKFLNTTIAGPTTGLASTAFNTNSYSNGATSSLNTDLNGNMFVNAQINRWGGTALGAPSNYGTSPGAVVVPGVNAFVTNTVTVAGGASNASSAVATSSTNVGAVAYLYASNGTTYDQLQVDGSKFLKVNCATGCSGGTFNNNADGVATSSTNGQAAAWLYGWNGTTFDRLQVDGSKNLKVTFTAATLAANQSVNVAQIGGTSTTSPVSSVNSASGAGAMPSALYGVFDDVSPTAITENNFGAVRMSANRNLYGTIRDAAGNERGANVTAGNALFSDMTSVGGSAVALGSTTGASSIPVVIASNQTAADPCMFQAKTNVPISTASGTVALVTGVSAKKIYVCSLFIIAPTAVSVSLAEGSSSTCGTSSQAAVIGVATNGTAANGVPLAANGGWTLGNGGGTIAATATAANYLCIFQSGTAQLAGNLTYVQQ